MSFEQPTVPLPPVRFIIVEDSFHVANALKFLLTSAGSDVAGMAGTLGKALEMAATESFDVALLDIDVRGEHAAPIADVVRRRGKAVVFLSGYGDAAILPPHLRDVPRLEKPVDPNELFAAVRRVLADPSA